MSELSKLIEQSISTAMESKVVTFSGKVTEYDHGTKSITVEIDNPTGAGKINLRNRRLPETGIGFSQAGVPLGSIATLVALMGQYFHAIVVAIHPQDMNYNDENRRSIDKVPRDEITTSNLEVLTNALY